MSRIIAGSAQGVQLRAPAGERTRPTTDRVREALFSTLASWAHGADSPPREQLAGLRVLDLFAGSGAIGLEAASRGAAEVVCVEQHKATAELIRRNIAAAKLDARVRVQPVSVTTYLGGQPHGFDVVFADPPYALPAAEVDHVLQLLTAGWLVPDGLVVVERSKRDAPPVWPAVIHEHWSRRYGETELYFGRTPPPDDGKAG